MIGTITPDGMVICRHGFPWPYNEVTLPSGNTAIIPTFCEARDHD